MTCNNTNPAAGQAFALALAGIAAANSPIIYHHPTPFAAAIFPVAPAALCMGRVRALFWERMRAMRALDAEWGL
jgi:hypothetical protein